MMWPFKWKFPSCTYIWCFLFLKILENEIWKFGWNLPWPHLAVKGLKPPFFQLCFDITQPCTYFSWLRPIILLANLFRYCNRMQEENITRAIIVVQMGMTPSAKQVSTRLIGGELNFYVSFGSIFLLFPMKVARGHFWGSRGKSHPPPPSVTPLGGRAQSLWWSFPSDRSALIETNEVITDHLPLH